MKKLLWRALVLIGVVVGLLATVVLIEVTLEQPMGIFAGSRPVDLGYSGGKFKPCSWRPNCANSTAPASDDKHYVAPLAVKGDPTAAWQKLLATLSALPRVKIVSQTAGYLHAEFKSAGLGFVDDVEFALDTEGRVIHVRSASRLGVRDFGVNRLRVEDLRARI